MSETNAELIKDDREYIEQNRYEYPNCPHPAVARLETICDRLGAAEEKIEQLKNQLKEGFHCSSFEMCGGVCGGAGQRYEAKIEQQQTQNDFLKKVVQIDVQVFDEIGDQYCNCKDLMAKIDWREKQVKQVEQALKDKQ